MVWTIFEVIVNFFQGFIIQQFMESRLHISRKHKLHDALCILIVGLYSSLALIVTVPLPDAIIFLIPLIYAWMVADDPWYASLFWTVVLAILFLSIISLMIHIFSSIPGSSYEQVMATTGFRIMFVLATNAALALTVYLTSKMKKDYSPPYWSVLFLFLLTNIGLFIVEESVYALQRKSVGSMDPEMLSYLGAYLGLCACTILVVCLFHMMSQSMERENQYKEEVNAIKHAHQYQTELEQMYATLIAEKHDMKHHVQVLEEMVRADKSEKAKAYLSAYQDSLNSNGIFMTGSTAVDALLMAKSLTMKRNQLLFHYTPYPLNELPVREPDFCTIVGNLLDNAIEGCLRIPEPHGPLTIHLTFSRSWDMFYIYCTNPCNAASIQAKNGRWISSKEQEGQAGTHAIGIRSMEHIAKAAEGRCAFTLKDNIFSAKVVIPFHNVKEQSNS